MALYDDQRICPAYLPDVARGLTRLVEWLASGKGDPPRVFHLVGAATTPFEFGKMLKTVFNCGDVSLRPSSVEGTPYARNLRLSTERTRGALGWSPTPHRAALQRARARRTTGTDADPGQVL